MLCSRSGASRADAGMRRGPVGDLLGRTSRSLLRCSGACSQVIELALDLRRALQLSEQSRQFCQGRCAGTGTACRPEGRISCSRLFGSDLEFGLGAPPGGDRGDSRHRAIVSRQRLPSLLNGLLFRGEIALPDQQALFALLLADESLSGRVLLVCLRLRDVGPRQLLLRLSQVGVHLSGCLCDVGVGLQAKDTEAAITHLLDCAHGIRTALDGSPAHRGQLILDVLVELRAEHFLQNLGPGARVGVEERRELPCASTMVETNCCLVSPTCSLTQSPTSLALWLMAACAGVSWISETDPSSRIVPSPRRLSRSWRGVRRIR